MKRTALIFFVLISVISCKKDTPLADNDFSLNVSDVKFNRSLNNTVNGLIVENGHLVVNAGERTNYFNSPDGIRTEATAPLILKEIDNTKPFTFTAKVSPSFTEMYDAGALFIHIDNNLWHKFAFEMDERNNTRVVTVRTIDTSDDNNHDIITQESVYMKISSDVQQIGFYFSTDNINWNLARLHKNDYPSTIWLGLSSQSPKGKGNQTIFEDISFMNDNIKSFRLGI